MQLNFDMTTIPTILLWVIGLLTFGIGALLGYFNMNIEARKKLDSAQTNAQIVRADAERKLAEAERKLEEAKTLQPNADDDPGLLRINKDRTIEMDGLPVSGALSAERKKRLIELVSILRPFLEAPTAQPVQPAAATISPPTVPPAAVPAPVTPVRTPSLLGGLTNPQPAKKDPEIEFKLLSIVQQIDTVLQKRLEGTPLAGQGIRLHDSPQGGVEVYIGIQKYETIDDVPDETIKKAIRAAVAEWEQKYTPGA